MSAVKEASCKPSKTFWLELTGLASLAGHEYVLVDAAGDDGDANCQTGSAQLLAKSSKYKGRMGPILAADIDAPEKRSLSLQLKGDEIVNAPLIVNEPIGPYTIRAPQQNYQDNLMVSVHPTLFCDAGELTRPRPMTGYNEAFAAPLRSGWVYVFFRGRLWRELSVMTREDAAPVLRDTAVENARTTTPEAANDRLVVGPKLNVIHVPARLLGNDVCDDVQFAFSETQWSWSYIAGLEQDKDLREKRCRHARAIQAFLKRLRMPDSNWSRVDDLAPMRARDNPLESDVTCPSHFLHDVSGDKLSEARQALITQRDAIESDETIAEADYSIETPRLYPRWRFLHLQGEAIPKIPGATDAWASLRKRHLMTLTLRDPLQAARHLVHQMNNSLSVMLALVDNVKKRPFGATAELFHNNFRRETLPDGNDNPLLLEDSMFDSRLDESDGGRLVRTVYDTERRILRTFLLDAQGALVRLLSDKDSGNLTAVLRDLFALESGNAVSGYFQTGPLLQALSLPANRTDPLLLPQDYSADACDEASELALSIAQGKHPLGTMLLPFTSDSQECQVGEATLTDLKDMVTALEDRGKAMRALEPNILRSIADHQDSQKSPDATALIGTARVGANAFSSVAGEFSRWWLTTVQAELTKRGKVFIADINRIKGAFEGFAQTAIPGKTTVKFGEGGDSRVYIVLDVLDEQGNTLTSGAAIASGLKVANADAFNGVVKHQAVKNPVHQATVRPGGLPTVLVVFDVWNLWSAATSNLSTGRYLAGIASAVADLGVSSVQLVSVLPKQPGGLVPLVAKSKEEAKWFNAMMNKINVAEEMAEEIVRSKLQVAGWVAGMFTTALMVNDSVVSCINGRWGTGLAQFTKAGGVATMASADIIAARILTPAGHRVVERASVQAAQAALGRLVPAAAGWAGTIASGYVTAIGFAIYVVGEAAYYRLTEDGVSEWLRAGPFSGDLDEQTGELASESNAYIGLVKAMTPVSFKRIADADLPQWLADNRLTAWQHEADAVLSFASPALAITGEPAKIEMELTYVQELYYMASRSKDPGGGDRIVNVITSRTGIVKQGVENRYSDQRQAIDFMVGRAQLSDLVPRLAYERVRTRYTVKNLTLTFVVDVWQRETQQYESQKVKHKMEGLEVERQQ